MTRRNHAFRQDSNRCRAGKRAASRLGQPNPYLAEQLKAFRSGKRAHEVMGVIAKPLKDADIADLAAWYYSLEIILKKEP